MRIQNMIYISNAEEEEVYNILRSLDINKGAGSDGIRSKDLKNNASYLTPIITSLINQSLNETIVPELLKIAIIRPIYKSGEKRDYNNYRPISNLSVVEKVLEEILIRRLRSFLEKYNVISKNLNGFQKGKNINEFFKSHS